MESSIRRNISGECLYEVKGQYMADASRGKPKPVIQCMDSRHTTNSFMRPCTQLIQVTRHAGGHSFEAYQPILSLFHGASHLQLNTTTVGI